VQGAGGSYILVVTGATVGATISGGSGRNILQVTGGGVAAMGSNITGIASVSLAAAPPGQTQPAYIFTANQLHGLEISDGSNGNDIITLGDASQIVKTGNGDVKVKATATTASARIITGSGHDVLDIGGGGTAVLNPLTSNITVKLDQATNLTLSGKSGVTAIGSGGGDTILAEAAGQTLTGNGGGDTLLGFSGGGDLFRDTVAGFTGVTIGGFTAPDDIIDVTDLKFDGASALQYFQGPIQGSLFLHNDTQSVTITLFGQFAAAGFREGTDRSGGTMITYTAPPHTQSPVIAASRG